MDKATVFGLVVGISSLFLSIGIESGIGGVKALFNIPALIIVFGGTIGATMIGYAMRDLSSIGNLFRVAFVPRKSDREKTLRLLVGFAETARREGLLSLEEKLEGLDNKFLEKGIRLIVDGTDPELIRSMLETELSLVEQRHKSRAGIFEAAGGFAPTMGIIGTVMGLVNALGAMADVSELSKSIASAFTATFYGVSTANLIWLPLAAKLKRVSHDEIIEGEMMLEGMLSILHGENPRIIEEKLMVFLEPEQRRKLKTGDAVTQAEETLYAEQKTARV